MPETARLLLTGAGGLLGSNIAKLAGDSFHVTKIFSPRAAGLNVIRLDLSRADIRDGLVERFRPDLVINCAANLSAQSCESREMGAHQINVELPADLAKQSLTFGAKFVHVSSDAVYSGESGSYSEHSQTSPANGYGAMKLESELSVLSLNAQSLVLRTNFFGLTAESDRGIADFFLSNLSKGRAVQGFVDSVVSSIYVDSLAKAIFELVDANISGVVNIGSSDSTSKYQLGQMIARVFDLDESLVLPANSNEVQLIPRGKDLSLDISLASSLVRTQLPTIYDGVIAMRHSLESGRRDALQQVIRQ